MFLYILQSNTSGQYYIGSTPNHKRRLTEHNNNQSKATKGRGPWKLVFLQKFDSTQRSRQIEYRLKKYKSKKIIEQIVKDQEIKYLRE